MVNTVQNDRSSRTLMLAQAKWIIAMGTKGQREIVIKFMLAIVWHCHVLINLSTQNG